MSRLTKKIINRALLSEQDRLNILWMPSNMSFDIKVITKSKHMFYFVNDAPIMLDNTAKINLDNIGQMLSIDIDLIVNTAPYNMNINQLCENLFNSLKLETIFIHHSFPEDIRPEERFSITKAISKYTNLTTNKDITNKLGVSKAQLIDDNFDSYITQIIHEL